MEKEKANPTMPVKEIIPKVAFPVHTENQHLFKQYCNRVQEIDREKAYPV